MSVHLRANNSDNAHKNVECPPKGFRLRLFQHYVFIQEYIIYWTETETHYVIKFLFINLIMKYPSLKNMCLHKACIVT